MPVVNSAIGCFKFYSRSLQVSSNKHLILSGLIQNLQKGHHSEYICKEEGENQIRSVELIG